MSKYKMGIEVTDSIGSFPLELVSPIIQPIMACKLPEELVP